ncbi:MAG: thioredoxin-disulfide reductase [Erysipelotrichaceae bacterium]|nr:thioredoxin-disulfide reductase [Erysipelotrichaceae bacterium]MBQ5804542.1 thioredoxin-disulfide reductase [Erysipelotrichaceae bacterium]
MDELYDVIIIGAGPAGLTAAIYASRANLKTLIFEAEVNGGKLSKTHEIENYPGIASISGLELAMQLSEHGQKFGAKLMSGTVDKIVEKDGYKTVVLTDGQEYRAKAIIVATGTRERMLDLPNAKEYTGRGISYCAVCDGFFYRNKKVAVIGGGNSALEESLYLASLASEVTIIIRRDVFRAEASVIDKVRANDKIRIVTRHVPDELVIENERIIGLKIRNVDTGEIQTVECSGIFPYIGADPCTSFLDPSVLDSNGYIIVNPDMSTSSEGIYAAGDCIVKDLRQVVTACNDGAIAANSVSRYLKK